jgi:hypothetical protein
MAVFDPVAIGPRWMSPEVALLRHAGGGSACLLMGEDRGQNDANDPLLTWAKRMDYRQTDELDSAGDSLRPFAK